MAPTKQDVEPCCSSPLATAMSPTDAASLAAKFKALGDPTRVRLLSMIAAHNGAEACVCDLTEPVGLSQPTVSHHLKILVDAGLLSRSKRGVWSYYAIVPGSLEAIANRLTAHTLATPTLATPTLATPTLATPTLAANSPTTGA